MTLFWRTQQKTVMDMHHPQVPSDTDKRKPGRFLNVARFSGGVTC